MTFGSFAVLMVFCILFAAGFFGLFFFLFRYCAKCGKIRSGFVLPVSFLLAMFSGGFVGSCVHFSINPSDLGKVNLVTHDINDMAKPVIYLYPEKTQDVKVSLLNSERITVSYPLHSGAWHVTARPNGSLTDKQTGRDLYSLYYESKSSGRVQMQKDGFCVSRDDVAVFLEDALARLGLTDREAEEFIIYWLPRLKAYPYVYIRFLTQEEIEHEMRVAIDPVPDCFIRVVMSWKGLNAAIEITPQKLLSVERKGFTAVEWGAIEIGHE